MRNGVLILNSNEFYKEFLEMVEYDEFDIVIVSGGDIKYNRQTPNVISADSLMPNMLCVNYLDGGSELKEDYKNFKNEYIKLLDKPVNHYVLANILYKAVCNDRPIVFMCSLSESKSRYLEILGTVIRDRYGVKTYSFESFKGNEEGLLIHNKEEVKRRLLLDMIQYSSYAKQAENYMEYCDVSIPLDNPAKILDMKWKNVCKVGTLLNVKYRKPTDKAEYIRQVLLAIKNRPYATLPTPEALEEFYSTDELMMLIRHLKLKVNVDATREDIIDRIVRYRDSASMDKAPSFGSLTNMSEKELIVQCKMADIEFIDLDKSQMIKSILEYYGDAIEHPLDKIDKQTLKDISRDDLFKLAMTIGIYNDSYNIMEDKEIRHNILKFMRKKNCIDQYKDVSERDLKRLSNKKLVKIAIKLDLLDDKGEGGYSDVPVEELVEIILKGFGTISSNDKIPMTIPKRKIIIEMKKKELIEIANSHNLGVTKLEDKEFIIEQLLELKERLKKEKKEVELEEVDGDAYKETLMGCTREKLEKFCLKNKISYDPSWSKKKLCKHIVGKYVKNTAKIKKKKEDKVPEIKFDDSFFTQDNLVLLQKCNLEELCKMFLISFSEEDTKKELIERLISHYKNPSDTNIESDEWEGVVTLAFDKDTLSKKTKKLKYAVHEALEKKETQVFTSFDDIRKEKNIETVSEIESDSILSIEEKMGMSSDKIKFKLKNLK